MTVSAVNGRSRVVVIDDDEQTLELIREELGSRLLEVFTSSSPEEGMRLIEEKRPEIVVVDSVLPRLCGVDFLQHVLEVLPGTNGVILGGCQSHECAVDAIKKGAVDYIFKPDFLPRLRRTIDQLIEAKEAPRRQVRAGDDVIGSFEAEGIIGRSPLMLAALEIAYRIAPYFRTALVTGQTGTGKELMARLLHKISPVAGRPFVVGNLSALAETLLESELFGHVRGAFTGAIQDKVGLFEAANGGTLFLDEIGELPLAAQTRLLRALQTREIQRVGSPQTRQLNIRVIAATNRDLRSMVAQGTFREDLYYRLAVAEIELPSLAERKDDLPLLKRHFLNRFASEFNKPRLRGYSEPTKRLLRRYGWPGNIRELENVLSYACMVAEGELIQLADLPGRLRTLKAEDMLEGTDMVPLEVMQRRYVRHVLDRMGGKRGHAASVLGINRMRLYRILKEDENPEETAEKTGSERDGNGQSGTRFRVVPGSLPDRGLGLVRARKIAAQ